MQTQLLRAAWTGCLLSKEVYEKGTALFLHLGGRGRDALHQKMSWNLSYFFAYLAP